jgi:hypothetical protein
MDKGKGIKDETDLPRPWRIIIRIYKDKGKGIKDETGLPAF